VEEHDARMRPTMDPKARRITDEAMGLPLAARAALAASLLRSLDGPVDPDAAEAWRVEIARRIRETDEGRSQPVPWAVAEGLIFET
jgi:putative addiction module component (TIGR02574 family)